MTVNPEIQTRVWKLIDAERQRQDEKWGEQNHGAPIWSLILGEEIGEVSEAYLDYIFKGGRHDIAPDEVRKYREAFMTELVQAAAVIVAWLECEVRRG